MVCVIDVGHSAQGSQSDLWRIHCCYLKSKVHGLFHRCEATRSLLSSIIQLKAVPKT